MALLDTLYANPIQFANEVGLYALLSIIPLIIIYLLRPRPKKINIPSIMFLLDIEKKKRLNIFRKFLKDPLFLIQLLVLMIISLAVAAPFIMATEEAGGGHTVIILDASASMQADGRFEKAVKEAEKYLSAKNTIILAENVPLLVMKEAPISSAGSAIEKLKAKATSTDLSSAMQLGRKLLVEGGRMVVLSDFISTSGEDPNIAKKVAEANGIAVDFVTIGGRTDNIGIVNGWFEPGGNYTLVIRNFNKDERSVMIDVTTGGSKVLSERRNIKGRASEYLSMAGLGTGVTRVSLTTNDALPIDDSAYVMIPESAKRNILYLTGNPNVPAITALRLLPFTTVETASPQYNEFNDRMIVFVGSPLTKKATQNITEYVKNGGNVVIIASPGLSNMELLPVELGNISNATTSLAVAVSGPITEGIAFENVKVTKHFKAKAKNGAVTYIEGGDKSVMLAYWKFGKGMVIYSGLADPEGDNIYDPRTENVWNDFHTRPEYLLFFKQLLEWGGSVSDMDEYNKKTGTLMKFPATRTVKTPGDSVTTNILLFDEVGIYGLGDRNVASNLYDEKESDLEPIEKKQIENLGITFSTETIRKPKYLDEYFIMAAMFLVFLELYYLRWRGEL